MKRVTERRWQLRKPDEDQVMQVSSACGIDDFLARILVNRGVGPAIAQSFLAPSFAELHDPFLLRGMGNAVVRLLAALENNERICIYGDYDVDGITSVALLVTFFRSIGADCIYHIPKRLEDGYGLAEEGIRTAVSQGARIIISVDCGVTAVAEAELCSSLGVDLIITDHHMPAAVLPAAVAVINPLQPGCPFPFKQLAGVGVAFNLLIALRSRLRETGYFDRVPEPNLREFLDLVALGTIADVVPLVDENRIFARYGLQEMSNSARPGLIALKNVAGVSGTVTCGGVGFRLAPRLNAAGRLEDAALGVELLLCREPRKAADIAQTLDMSNRERQALEQEILREALAMIKDDRRLSGRKSIVLASETWHPGVIGIVASRMVDLYHRPTVLIALQDGSGRGSGRSIPNFHLHDALRACSAHLVAFGGHKHAAGLTIDEATLEEFIEMFDEIAAGSLAEADLSPELYIDAELEPDAATLRLAEAIETLAPFGMGNPEPVFVMRKLAVMDRRIVSDAHLKLRLSAGSRIFDAIGFNMAGSITVPRVADVAFTLQVNDWNGRKSLQLRLKDVKEAA